MESNAPQSDHQPPTCCGEKRRGLVKGLLAAAIGGFVALFPFVPGLLVVTSPLRKKRKLGGQMIRITTLGALAGSKQPRRFQVIASRRDAWNKYPPEPIAGVYLAPQGEGKPPRAFFCHLPSFRLCRRLQRRYRRVPMPVPHQRLCCRWGNALRTEPPGPR